MCPGFSVTKKTWIFKWRVLWLKRNKFKMKTWRMAPISVINIVNINNVLAELYDFIRHITIKVSFALWLLFRKNRWNLASANKFNNMTPQWRRETGLIAGFQCHAIQNRSKSKSKPFNSLMPESGKSKEVNIQRPSPRFGSEEYFLKCFTQI